jgi:hypothetical protein
MTQPKRLLEELGPGFDRELLLSGSRERPPEGARARVESSLLVGLGVAPLVMVPRTVLAAGAAKSKGLAFGAAAKWVIIGAMAGSISTVATVAVTDARLRPTPSAVESPSSPPDREARPAPRRDPAEFPAPTRRAVQPAPARPVTGTVRIGSPTVTSGARSQDALGDADEARRLRARPDQPATR